MKFKLICVDGVYIGLLNGNPFMSDNLTSEQIKTLVNNPTEEQVVEIFNPKLAEVAQYNREVKDIQDILVGSGLFELKQGSYFRVGIPYSVPKLLLDKYKEKIVNGLTTDALDNFWVKCCLNPNVYTRENLFEYLQRWEFVITSKGYIVSYRNANILQRGNKDLHDFVATQYTKIRGQKKAPKNYNVYDDNSYVLVKDDVQNHGYNNFVGNLQELYNNLPALFDTVYTDAYSGTTRIRVGELVSIPRSSCDESQQECSAGLNV